MSRKLLIRMFLFSATISIIAGCGESEQAETLLQPDDVVLVEVDGEPVTLDMLEFLMEGQGVDEENTEGMRGLLDELIRRRAVANRATEQGLSTTPEVRAERMVKDIEIQYARFLEDLERENSISEEEIRAVYQAQVERAGNRRFQLVTIEFPAQAEALEQLNSIQSGELDFDQAIDLATADGRLARSTGWIDASQVPGDFAAILEQTQTGAVVDGLLPYEGQWLIVRLADTDELVPPPLEDVREGIRRTLLGQQIQSTVDRIFESATITPMLPLDGEAPNGP